MQRSTRLALASALVLTVGCGRIGFDPLEPFGPFGEPVPVAALDDPGFLDGNPTATGDVLEMYFSRVGDDLPSRIFVSTRRSTSEPWGEPSLVTELSAEGAVRDPEITADGLRMHLTSTIPGNDEIFVSTRPSRDAPWSRPVAVIELNSELDDGSAAPADGGLLVMDSRRGGEGFEIFASRRIDEAWSTPVQLTELSSPASDTSPFLFDGGLRILFDSTQGGDEDLWVATREDLDAPFSAPVPFEGLNSPYEDSDAWISPDGSYALMASDRSGRYMIYEAFR